MESNTAAAVILSHCNGMSLIFGKPENTNAISATGKNRAGSKIPSISELDGHEIETLLLLCCNAGHLDLLEEKNTNVADAFRDLESVDTVYAYDGSVGFGIPVFSDKLNPRLALDQSGYFDVYTNFDVPYYLDLPSGLQRYEDD